MCKYKDFLAAKPMYYAQIDYERFERALAALGEAFKSQLPPVVHVVGTNGKGSTGRFLAMILRASGKRVGHYTSPHITDFRERFWIDGRLSSDEELEAAHERVLARFSNLNNSNLNCEDFVSNLSYFEWATLLAAELFRGLDEVILEAGMGGEFDATNFFAKKLSVFTPVDLDHVAMLGDSIEKIATTKLNSMDKKAVICADYAVPEIAEKIAAQKGCDLKTAPAKLIPAAREYALKFELPDFLANNLNLAAFAAGELGVSNLNEILSNLGALDLPGRLQKVRPNLWLDVGHNAHAARAVASYFSKYSNLKKLALIYNAFDDKDVDAVLEALSPVLGKILIYPYESKRRALAGEKIALAASNLNVACEEFSRLNEGEPTLVFGSFMLVSEFARRELEK